MFCGDWIPGLSCSRSTEDLSGWCLCRYRQRAGEYDLMWLCNWGHRDRTVSLPQKANDANVFGLFKFQEKLLFMASMPVPDAAGDIVSVSGGIKLYWKMNVSVALSVPNVCRLKGVFLMVKRRFKTKKCPFFCQLITSVQQDMPWSDPTTDDRHQKSSQG